MSDLRPIALRLFVAIELSESWRSQLAALSSDARSLGLNDYRWVSPELLHITLLFLGTQPSSLLPDIRAALEAAASMTPPFTLRLGGLGGPAGRLTRGLWVVVEDEARLGTLRARLERRLERSGIAFDQKALRPHVTLARARRSGRETPAPTPCLNGALRHAEPQAVEQIALVRSDLGHDGPRYTVLARASLAGVGARRGCSTL